MSLAYGPDDAEAAIEAEESATPVPFFEPCKDSKVVVVVVIRLVA